MRKMTATEKAFFDTIQFENFNGTKLISSKTLEIKAIAFAKQALKFKNEDAISQSVHTLAKVFLYAQIIGNVSDELIDTFLTCMNTNDNNTVSEFVGYDITEEGHLITGEEVQKMADIHRTVALRNIKVVDTEMKEFAKAIKKHPENFGIEFTQAEYKHALKFINDFVNAMRKEINDNHKKVVAMVK